MISWILVVISVVIACFVSLGSSTHPLSYHVLLALEVSLGFGAVIGVPYGIRLGCERGASQVKLNNKSFSLGFFMALWYAATLAFLVLLAELAGLAGLRSTSVFKRNLDMYYINVVGRAWKGSGQWWVDHFARGHRLYEAIVVGCSFAVMLLAPLPTFALAVFYQLELGATTGDGAEVVTLGDVLFPSSQNMWLTDKAVSTANAFIFALGFFYWVVGAVSLLLDSMNWTDQTREAMFRICSSRSSSLSRRPLLNRILEACLAFLTGLFMCSWLGYATLVACWCLLGAIVNPEKYLPYAAGAATAATFIINKYRSLTELRRDFIGKLEAIIQQKMKKLLKESPLWAKDMADQSGLSSALDKPGALGQMKLGGVKAAIAKVAEHQRGELGQKLQQNLESVGLDMDAIKAAAQGDISLLLKPLENAHMNKSVLKALLAAARRDNDAVVEAVVDLGKELGMPAGILGVLTELLVALPSCNNLKQAELAAGSLLFKVNKCV